MWKNVANLDQDVSVIQIMSWNKLHHNVSQRFLSGDIDVLSHDTYVLQPVNKLFTN